MAAYTQVTVGTECWLVYTTNNEHELDLCCTTGLENITNFLETQYPEPSIGKTGSGSSPSETKEAYVAHLIGM